jgi:hypothetical protein
MPRKLARIRAILSSCARQKETPPGCGGVHFNGDVPRDFEWRG